LVAQIAVFICFGAYGLGFDFVPRCHIFLSKAAGVVSLVSSISPFPRSFHIQNLRRFFLTCSIEWKQMAFDLGGDTPSHRLDILPKPASPRTLE
jgi:hypothetical protein